MPLIPADAGGLDENAGELVADAGELIEAAGELVDLLILAPSKSRPDIAASHRPTPGTPETPPPGTCRNHWP